MAMRRRAFTLLELMVVLSVIGLLIALAMPAVQRARDRARALQCANNLRQLGLALHNYHASHSILPPGVSQADWTFKLYLLPYLDQAPLYGLIDFRNCFAYGCFMWQPEANRLVAEGKPDLLTVPIALFECPSDPRSGHVRADLLVRAGNYLGVSGTGLWSPAQGNWKCPGLPNFTGPVPIDGMLGHGSAVRLEHVRDGLTQTLMVGERGISNTYIGIGELVADYQGGVQHAVVRKPDETSGDQVGHFWSWHGDGAHFAFGDASVRFLGYGIDSRVLTALGTANGGESVSDY